MTLEEGGLRELAGIDETEEKEIAQVEKGLKKIESVSDLSTLPLTLIQDVYRLSEEIEDRGTLESKRFASDSKRRLLDSLIKGQTLIQTVPHDCETCPRNADRIMDNRERRVSLAQLFDTAELTPQQWEKMSKLMPHPFIKNR